jgi:hypothetical protein
MFKKNKILKFESAIEVYPNTITPAKAHIPEWYKKIKSWENDKIFDLEKGFRPTIKHCMPFIDSLTTGYMLVLPYDLYVTNSNGEPYISWRIENETPIRWRDKFADEKIVPFNHYPTEYTWTMPAAFVVPKKYSLLIMHPLNRHDLPFTTLSGIIDGEFVMQANGNLPFFIKNGFEGIIYQGTPIAQLIPFRQENWTAKITKGILKEGKKNGVRTTSVLFGWYKKTFWRKKRYE